MQFSALNRKPTATKTPCLVITASSEKQLTGVAENIDTASSGLLTTLKKSGDLKGSLAETMLLQQPAELAAERLLVVGTGDQPLNEQDFSKLASAIASALVKLPVKAAAISLDDIEVTGRDTVWQARQLAQAIVLQTYLFNPFNSKARKPAKLNKVTVLTSSRKGTAALEQALITGAAIGAGMNVAKELGDLPGNICTPGYLAKQARSFSRKHTDITCNILSEKEMHGLGMHSLLSVSAGSAEPAKLITLNYKGGKKSDRPLVLVGKGVTFDSGGISLKPGAAMDEMKYDMCGAASVFGTLTAVAELNLPVNIVGIVPAVENMPSSTATKPGDIVKSMSGQTIEILNTDAEGRLILCDALTYADRFKPDTVIDIATLTGACVVALGNHATGLFSNNDELAEQLLQAGKTANDRAWPMPIWPEYDEQLKSNFADMANIGGRNAGSSTAACFLSRFTKDYRWAHLDIAGTAWNSGAKKGATGRPVPLLMAYILEQLDDTE
jgi:leucyl aminopeptidase